MRRINRQPSNRKNSRRDIADDIILLNMIVIDANVVLSAIGARS